MNLPSVQLTASYGVPLLFALLVHGVAIGLTSMNWQSLAVREVSDLQPYYIEAAVVQENPYKAKQAREQQRRQAEREARARQRLATDSRLREEQAKWEKEKASIEEAHRQAAEEQLRAAAQGQAEPAEPAQDPEEVRFRNQLAESVAAQLSVGEAGRKAVTNDEKAMAYVAQIQQEIIQNWSRPPSARNGMQAILRVVLIPTGEVVNVQVDESSGNHAFDQSAILAVRKAERFLVPQDMRSFEANFREFTVLFRPEDLRL